MSTPSICHSQLSVARACLKDSYDARAAFEQPRLDAFAAVMGNAMSSQLGPNRVWSVDDFTATHDPLWSAMSEVEQSLDHHDPTLMRGLNQAINQAVHEALIQSHEAIADELRSIRTMDPSQRAETLSAAGEEQGTDHAALVTAISESDTKLKESLDKLNRSLTTLSENVSSSVVVRERTKAIEKYDTDMSFNTKMAKKIEIADLALLDVSQKLAVLNDRFASEGRGTEYYSSPERAELFALKKSIISEKSGHESELQDHYQYRTQGAHRSETYRAKSTTLTLPKDMHLRTKGEAIIVAVDTDARTKGNSYWAIIPILEKIGHDVDDAECMHWKPEGDHVFDPALFPFIKEQREAYAVDFNSACTPKTQKSILLTQNIGNKQVQWQADPHNGYDLYFATLNLYNPLDRIHKTAKEDEIIALPKLILSQREPKAILKTIQQKAYEAADLGCVLNWEQVGVPIVRNLMERLPQFSGLVNEWATKTVSREECIPQLDKLISAILNMWNTYVHTDNVSSYKGAKKAKGKGDDEDIDTKIAKALSKALQAQGLSGGHKGDGKPKHSNSPGGQRQGQCQVCDCNRTIMGWTKANNWKLCGTCLLEVRTSGSPKQLKDGSEWGSKKKALAGIAERVQAGTSTKGFAKALKVARDFEFPVDKTKKKKNAKDKKRGAKSAQLDEEEDTDGGGDWTRKKSKKAARAAKRACLNDDSDGETPPKDQQSPSQKAIAAQLRLRAKKLVDEEQDSD
jgi:hypothetical protein